VKKGILLGFRMGVNVDMSVGTLTFRDKDTYPTKTIPGDRNIRIVPGGSSVRDGVYLGQNVTCMPPMYINVGAYIDDGTMVDSHALVGSCAQVGKNCHVSAASQIGGVLEPVGALPVIIEDDVSWRQLRRLRRHHRQAAPCSHGHHSQPLHACLRPRPQHHPLCQRGRPAGRPRGEKRRDARDHQWSRKDWASASTPPHAKYRDARTDAHPARRPTR
jgi:hypothetical protein